LHNPIRKVTPISEEETFSFEVGDFVYLKVSPMRGTKRFKVKRKLAPRYVGPLQILDHKG
jgi:hypothetical protein